MTPSEIVGCWQAAWESLDPARVEALYAPGATHMSSVVAERMNRADGTLRGPGEIRAYAEAAASRLTSFKADILQVISDETDSGGRASVEYWRILNGDEAGRTRVVEIIEWSGGRITACRVFHF
ncbi:MAG: nuclear transport factor 2 family protein [Parvibaculum sp.]|uniref:nuclear transport factor 2 family protein n=1 Tax=Parvibaculum sp. TaxID=2024848 RepID=UPI0032EFC024